MRRLVFRDANEDNYELRDARRIVRVMAERGYEVSIQDAHAAWEAFSGSMAAGWMCLPDDDGDLFATVFHYFAEVSVEEAEDD